MKSNKRLRLPSTRFASGKSHKASGKVSATRVYERDILCILIDHPKSSGVFSFPRGKLRIDLGKNGLMGKTRLESCMTEAEIFAKIRSCFGKACGFHYISISNSTISW